MSNSTAFVNRLASLAVCTAALAAPLAAHAQSRNATAQQLYQDAVSSCNAGQRTQSRADCMNEARSVLRDARAGRAWTMEGTSMDSPQLDRDTQPAADQERSQRRQDRMPKKTNPVQSSPN